MLCRYFSSCLALVPIVYVWFNIRGIRMMGFWHLECGFRRIFSFTAPKCAWKVRFYKPCTSAASESEFDHTSRIPRLKSKRASLYRIRVIQLVRLAIDRLLILWSLHWPFYCCETDRETDDTTFLSTLKTMREDNSVAPESAHKTLACFNCTYLFAGSVYIYARTYAVMHTRRCLKDRRVTKLFLGY